MCRIGVLKRAPFALSLYLPLPLRGLALSGRSPCSSRRGFFQRPFLRRLSAAYAASSAESAAAMPHNSEAL